MHTDPVNLSQSELKRSLDDDEPLDWGVPNDVNGEDPKSTSKFDPVALVAGDGATKPVPGCWHEAADCSDGCGNFTPGATLVPAPGGGGSRTPAAEDGTEPRDRDFDDMVTGASDPSTDFFA